MCGIAGFLSGVISPAFRQEAVQKMCDAMAHRGPDDAGLITAEEATLGMRRLAIFDPAHGRQPMASPDGRYHLVFNGAIYNFRELRAECEGRGWRFRTQCDTEVLLALLSQQGEQAIPRLRGMFAFALWDATQHSLIAARDAFGQKPFFYAASNGALLFASESRALLLSGHVERRLDPLAATEFLRWQSIPAPRTLHVAVRALRPGGLLRWREGRVTTSTWWSPIDALGLDPYAASAEVPRASSVEALRRQLRERLDDSIKAHIIADVPVGAFLSGGLDSAVIVAMMARHLGSSLKTFSMGFEEEGWSEAREAEETARHVGVEHYTHVLTGREVADDVESILAGLDQPTGDGLNTYYVARTARLGGITVGLSGLGSDEFFGGYPSFTNLPRLARLAPWWTRLPESVQRAICSVLESGNTSTRKLATSLRAAASPASLALAQRAVLSEQEIASVLSPGRLQRAEAHPIETMLNSAWMAMAAKDPAVQPWVTLASLAEACGYMVDVLLRDADEFSMRHSLELRVPFVDRPLAEWVWAQHPDLMYHASSTPKGHLAAACADLLPPRLLSRRKRGFSLPFPRWLRGPLRPFMDATMAPGSAGKSGLFAKEAPGRLWQTFINGRDDRAWSRVWSLAVLIHLANRT